MRLTRCLALVLLGGSVCGAGCGGPSVGEGCRYQSWQGKCRLDSVRTARVVERFPQSYVVVEALYEPQNVGGQFSPPPFRKETIAPAEQEIDLTNHIHDYPVVDCAVANPIGDPCAPKMAVTIPDFVPNAAATNPQVATGCAKIEHQDVSTSAVASVPLPGPFQFDENSVAESPVVLSLADDAANAIRNNPRIECVAIKGQSAPGEPFSLANDRAQAVRKLLESRGIDRSRLIIFEATAPTYTGSPDEQPPAADARRVHLSVVVYTPETPK